LFSFVGIVFVIYLFFKKNRDSKKTYDMHILFYTDKRHLITDI
jgi:hypothetical protein